MSTVLTILIIVAMIATVVALVRGIVAFLRTTEQDLKGTGPSASSLKQNKAMQMRILFQAIAILLVVLLLALYSGGS
ncbi:twin transmembrane helix small protein [Sphingomonas cavernae]|uniref:Twin transmembrane helix small protein n=1 Tax=Sphingomonas cavernae TaxID=2320861 RepID=A0A418WRJ7_9SPHN|nr:twin transmembrane helix small protein [Sphingomonas cavernae]RJF93865.1 twin transmembrane helix small protein [Sphingomonas cavernae]